MYMMRIANLIFHSPASITTHLANLHTRSLPSATSQAATLTDAHRPPHMVGSGRTGEAAACIIRMHTQLSRRLSSTLAPNIPLTQLSIRLVHIAKLPSSSYGSSALPGDVEGVVKALHPHPHRAGDTILCQIGCTVHRCTTGSATQKCTGGTQDRPKVVHHPFPPLKSTKAQIKRQC